MSGSGTGPRDLDLPRFDPAPSLQTALELLNAANVPHALVGRLAIWTWVPPDQQALTKDVDFAVPEALTSVLLDLVRARGLAVLPLSIGGFAIRDGEIRIDFIDRRVDFSALYSEAVTEAARQGTRSRLSSGVEVLVAPPEYLVAMKLATGDPRDEQDVERLVSQDQLSYQRCRSVTRAHLGPAAANRLDHIAARTGHPDAARYVRASNGGSKVDW